MKCNYNYSRMAVSTGFLLFWDLPSNEIFWHISTQQFSKFDQPIYQISSIIPLSSQVYHGDIWSVDVGTCRHNDFVFWYFLQAIRQFVQWNFYREVHPLGQLLLRKSYINWYPTPWWGKPAFSSDKIIIRACISAQTTSGTFMCEPRKPLTV